MRLRAQQHLQHPPQDERRPSTMHRPSKTLHVRAIGLVLTAAVTFIAITTNAWAASEWFQRGNVITTEPFLLGTLAPTTLAQLRGPKFTISCEVSRAGGDLQAPNRIVRGAILFRDCSSEAEAKVCTVKSVQFGEEGVILTRALTGMLGPVAVAESSSERGLEFTPEAKTPIAEIEGKCLPGGGGTKTIKESITGSVIGEIEPKGHEETTLNVKFKIVSAKQKIKKFTGEAEKTWSAFGEELAFESAYSVKFELFNCLPQAIEVT